MLGPWERPRTQLVPRVERAPSRTASPGLQTKRSGADRTAVAARSPQPIAHEDALAGSAFRPRRGVALGMVGVVLALSAVAVALARNQYEDGKRRALGDAHARVVLAA